MVRSRRPAHAWPRRRTPRGRSAARDRRSCAGSSDRPRHRHRWAGDDPFVGVVDEGITETDPGHPKRGTDQHDGDDRKRSRHVDCLDSLGVPPHGMLADPMQRGLHRAPGSLWRRDGHPLLIVEAEAPRNTSRTPVMTDATGREASPQIAALINETDICLFTTVGEGGELHARPMSNNGQVPRHPHRWFFGRRSMAAWSPNRAADPAASAACSSRGGLHLRFVARACHARDRLMRSRSDTGLDRLDHPRIPAGRRIRRSLCIRCSAPACRPADRGAASSGDRRRRRSIVDDVTPCSRRRGGTRLGRRRRSGPYAPCVELRRYTRRR